MLFALVCGCHTYLHDTTNRCNTAIWCWTLTTCHCHFDRPVVPISNFSVLHDMVAYGKHGRLHEACTYRLHQSGQVNLHPVATALHAPAQSGLYSSLLISTWRAQGIDGVVPRSVPHQHGATWCSGCSFAAKQSRFDAEVIYSSLFEVYTCLAFPCVSDVTAVLSLAFTSLGSDKMQCV